MTELASLAALRTRVTYVSQLAPMAEVVLTDSARDISELLSSPARRDRVRARLNSTNVLAALLASYECVSLLVGSELDTVTPGERGLGRASTAIPRVGGHFRPLIDLHTTTVLGKVMEELCIQGFAARVAFDALVSDDTELLRFRSLDAFIPIWISGIIYGLEGASEDYLAVVNAASTPTIGRFLAAAEAQGLARPLRKKRDLQLLKQIAILLVGAGSELCGGLMSTADDQFD
jgi:hypothetical protein